MIVKVRKVAWLRCKAVWVKFGDEWIDVRTLTHLY